MRAQSRSICRRQDAAAKLLADLEAHGETVDLLVNNAGFGLIGRFAELDAKRERQMIDLNVGTLTDLCRAVAPGDDQAQVGRDPQRRFDRRLPARPEDGGLFRDQGVRAVAERSAARGTEAARRARSAACAPGPTRTEFGDVAGFGGNGLFDRVAMDAPTVVEAGLDGLDEEQGGGRSGPAQQARRGQHAVRAAFGRSQDRRSDQILNQS